MLTLRIYHIYMLVNAHMQVVGISTRIDTCPCYKTNVCMHVFYILDRTWHMVCSHIVCSLLNLPNIPLQIRGQHGARKAIRADGRPHAGVLGSRAVCRHQRPADSSFEPFSTRTPSRAGGAASTSKLPLAAHYRPPRTSPTLPLPDCVQVSWLNIAKSSEYQCDEPCKSYRSCTE